MKRTPLRADPEKVRAFQQRARENTRPNRKPVSPASLAQKLKVRDQRCVNCGAERCDPAHLTSRAQGGCDSADCVIALCRACHRDFDLGRIDLEPVLALREFALERSHMAFHLTFEQCRRRLNGLAYREHAA